MTPNSSMAPQVLCGPAVTVMGYEIPEHSFGVLLQEHMGFSLSPSHVVSW